MYDLYGNQTTSFYGGNGEEINTLFDINGTVVYEKVDIVPTPLEVVPSYFQEDVVNAVGYVDTLGNDYANYVVVTDTHYSSNCGNSSNICNYLYGTGKFDKMIHLGDFLESGAIGSENWNAMIDADFCRYKKWIMTQGNHDSGIYPFSDALPYFEANEVNYVSHNYHNGFYYDNKKHKIRFIGLHHMLYANSAIRSEIEGFLNTMPNGYKWCFISHYPMLVNTEWVRTKCMSESAELWLKGLIDTYPNFIGVLSGHLHLDEHDVASTETKDFHHITLDADILRNGNVGTNNEQVVTIVSINPITENVKFYRIGRSITYESKQWEYMGFTK
mgnify:CR=1 FL=1